MRCETMTPGRMIELNIVATEAALDLCNQRVPPVPICEVFNRAQRRRHARLFEALVYRLTDSHGFMYTEVGAILGCDHTAAMGARRRHVARLARERKSQQCETGSDPVDVVG